ncbi:MAG: hypothetical protein IPL61_27750 [Myxococcales bacterium]|nr:hypothetical protein [Myxococcales bacterium]
MTASGADLVAIARLRSEIAILARGGEYDLAQARLLELATLDLRVGLRADALLRTRQAAELARSGGQLAEELQAELLLALAEVQAGSFTGAEQAADTVLLRSGALEDHIRRPLVTSAYLVRGMASRRAGSLVPARVALDQCRQRAVMLGRADLSALALAELGLVELADGDPAAAAVCFTFARDAFGLAGQDTVARGVELLALDAFVASGRLDEARAIATATLADADARGDDELAARAAGVLADALAAAGERPQALIAADDAAQRTRRLTGERGRALAVRARLRQATLIDDPGTQALHLEAAVDGAVASGDAAILATALDALVAGAMMATLPPAAWAQVAELARACRAAGLLRLADMADAALAELR